jgi:hypothetical protein
MRKAYAALLGLYPAEHQALFASEMLGTFDQAALQRRGRGVAPFLYFAACELAGLLRGLLTERVAKWTAGEAYLISCAPSEDGSSLPTDVADVERRVQRIVRCMEFAIAHHDFAGARRYSREERTAREHLGHLLSADQV